MTEENTDGISREAFDRVKGDLAKANSKLADAERKVQDADAAIRDVQTIEKAYEHFVAKDVPNAYGVAREAILNPRVKGADPDTLTDALDGWYTHSTAIFGGRPEAAPEPEKTPEPVAPMTQPNPTAPGTPLIGGAPVMVGSAEWKAKFGGLSPEAQRAAIDRNEAVFSPEVTAAQKTLTGA